jgi:hypothetical protein
MKNCVFMTYIFLKQEMIARQLHKLQENRKMDVTQFQNWLLKEGAQSIKDQEQLIRHR